MPFSVSQTGLLAVVRQTEGEEVIVDLTTDIADDVVLHWGVSPLGDNNGWVQPEKELLPDEDSIRIKNGIAAETPFTARSAPAPPGAAPLTLYLYPRRLVDKPI